MESADWKSFEAALLANDWHSIAGFGGRIIAEAAEHYRPKPVTPPDFPPASAIIWPYDPWVLILVSKATEYAVKKILEREK